CGDEGLEVPGSHHVYATRRGKVAAVYCNFEKGQNRCKRAVVEAKRKQIGQECGDGYVAGFTEWIMYIPGVSYGGMFGYGFGAIGDDKKFCGH
ncbi:hypothetical protein MAPG_10608, partial [Magnaporthiopsis poae ATCC 64411]|uniref:Uncharacterized protein n=1 Tax=Magnaporthiopsis poae (strain ATCC 64411 / 73-15) TaxID=644358 RepID=A0A0C4ED16_MAGP6